MPLHAPISNQTVASTVLPVFYTCDPLSKNPALRANTEFELEAILFIQVVLQLNSDYRTKVSLGAGTVSCEIMKPGSATITMI